MIVLVFFFFVSPPFFTYSNTVIYKSCHVVVHLVLFLFVSSFSLSNTSWISNDINPIIFGYTYIYVYYLYMMIWRNFKKIFFFITFSKLRKSKFKLLVKIVIDIKYHIVIWALFSSLRVCRFNIHQFLIAFPSFKYRPCQLSIRGKI